MEKLISKDIDKQEVERSIRELYAMLHKRSPEIIYSSSPLSAVAAAVLSNRMRGSWLSSYVVPSRSADLPNPIADLTQNAILAGMSHDDSRNTGEIAAKRLAAHAISGSLVQAPADPLTDNAGKSMPHPSADTHACAAHIVASIFCPKRLHCVTEVCRRFEELSRASGGFLCFENLAFVVDQRAPVERVNQTHNSTGALFEYSDGWGVYALYGEQVPQFLVRSPEQITLGDIRSAGDSTLRGELIGRYGKTRYWSDLGARPFQQDAFGTLFHIQDQGRTSILLRVINSTPEPDGSFAEYFLKVPPDMKTAREAVAWTFGLSREGYQPSIET